MYHTDFLRAAIPDVYVPGNLLHVRPAEARSRNEEPNTESSWVAVLVRQSTARRYTEEPHCVHMAAEELEHILCTCILARW